MRTEPAWDDAQLRELLLSAIADPTRIAGWSAADQEMTVRLARRCNLLGRLAANIADAGKLDALQPTVRRQLQSALTMAKARARLAAWELDRIDWALTAFDAPDVVLMKGCAYQLLRLPNVKGRIFADVDLMVAESRLNDIEAILLEAGWCSQELSPYDDNYYRRWTHELPPLIHEEREVEIDLHHNILPRTARLKPSSTLWLKNSRRINGSRFLVLSDEDMVLHAMVHLMFDSDLADKLRDLVDIRDLMAHFAGQDAAFWDRLLVRAEEQDLRRPTYYSLRYTSRLLGFEPRADLNETLERWAPPRLLGRLMDRMVPEALFPRHPDRHSVRSATCRLFLYMRSHWLRMPPWLLIYHLSYKFVVTRAGLNKKR